ncbi:hypothetical protein [Halegenticoccus soli]|uniref:hypothetical protein n=1 Tax=Halegenticoccus soli TaxID=1985678 RepID=UPI000C6DB4E3|nr:hypothetical protein [Halegenticoccus soli]
MHRRRFLAAVGTGAVSAGCLGRDERKDDVPPDDTAFTASLDGVTTYRYLLDLSYGGSLDVRAPHVTDLPAGARAAVESAIEEGRYEIDDPSDELRYAVRTGYAAADDRIYGLDSTFPELVLTLDPVPRDAAAPGRTADVNGDVVRRTRAVNEVVGSLVRGKLEHRTTALDPKLRAFLSEYDFVRHSDGCGKLTLSVDDPGPPYALRATPADESRIRGGTVADLADLPPAARRAIRGAFETDGRRYRMHDLPAELEESVAAYDYVRIEGEYYEPYLFAARPESLPVRFEAALGDAAIAPDSPATLTRSVTNTGHVPVTLFCGAPPPFGVLSAKRRDGEGGVVLWSDRYETSDYVHPRDDGTVIVNSIGLGVPLLPGETMRRTYLLRADARNLAPGTYVVDDYFGVRRWGEDGGERETGRIRDTGDYPYRLALTVASTGG